MFFLFLKALQYCAKNIRLCKQVFLQIRNLLRILVDELLTLNLGLQILERHHLIFYWLLAFAQDKSFLLLFDVGFQIKILQVNGCIFFMMRVLFRWNFFILCLIVLIYHFKQGYFNKVAVVLFRIDQNCQFFRLLFERLKLLCFILRFEWTVLEI